MIDYFIIKYIIVMVYMLYSFNLVTIFTLYENMTNTLRWKHLIIIRIILIWIWNLLLITIR